MRHDIESLGLGLYTIQPKKITFHKKFAANPRFPKTSWLYAGFLKVFQGPGSAP